MLWIILVTKEKIYSFRKCFFFNYNKKYKWSQLWWKRDHTILLFYLDSAIKASMILDMCTFLLLCKNILQDHVIIVEFFFGFSAWKSEDLPSSSSQTSRAQSSPGHPKDNKSIISSVLGATWYPESQINHADSYTKRGKCPFICKDLYWEVSWEKSHSILVISKYELFQNPDSPIPCNTLLEESCFKVYSASIHRWFDSINEQVFLCPLRFAVMFPLII